MSQPAPQSKKTGTNVKALLGELAAARAATEIRNRIAEPEVRGVKKVVAVIVVPNAGTGVCKSLTETQVDGYRIALINALLASPPSSPGPWAFSWLNSILFNMSPGLTDVLAETKTGIEFALCPATASLLGALDGIVDESDRGTGDDEITEAPDQLDEVDEDKWYGAVEIKVGHPMLDGGVIKTQYRTSQEPWETLTAVAIMLFGIAKPASVVNYRGFTENRTKAMTGFLGTIKGSGGALSLSMFPSIRTLEIVKGLVGVHHQYRVALCTELVKWAEASSPDTTQRIVGLVIQLWRGSGMTHVGLIHALIEGYSEPLCEIPALEGELIRFIQEALAISKRNDPYHQYCKAINGDKDKTLHSQNYPELFKIAVVLARRKNESMANYGRGVKVSAFQPAFEECCWEASIVLPGSAYAPDVSEE